MDEEYSQFDEDYEYYITPFGNYVNENKNETLDIITCEGPYDTIEEAVNQGIDFEMTDIDHYETWNIIKVERDTNKIVSTRKCTISVDIYIDDENEI